MQAGPDLWWKPHSDSRVARLARPARPASPRRCRTRAQGAPLWQTSFGGRWRERRAPGQDRTTVTVSMTPGG